jgi:hypothetical protein
MTEGAASDACPDCGGPSRVVTSVTVPALGGRPRTVLVTRQCTDDGCHLKFPVFKSEDRLAQDERAAWTRR